ncbi:NEDD4-binding protein 1, partial [Pseudolycoriella hygida]
VALENNDKITENATSESWKRKLIHTQDTPVVELPKKQICVTNRLETILELQCTPIDNSEVVENADSIIVVDDDTLIANVDKEFVEETFDNKEVNFDAPKEIQNEESSIYKTVSETYCSDTSVTFCKLSCTDNIPIDPIDVSTKENDSVIFVGEFLSDYCYGQSSCNQANHSKNEEALKHLYESFNETLHCNKRMVLIDGSNVAFSHSCQRREFSVEGISICLDYFTARGYDVKAVVPQMRLKRENSTNSELLEQLKAEDYKRIIRNRVIGYMFCNNTILFPKDPYGRYGPTLDEILIKKH